MSSTKPLTWLVTGANAGFGLELCLIALQAGHTVIGTVRPSSKVPQSLEDAGIHIVRTEIAAPAKDIVTLVDGLVTKFGQVDVLVNNAGFAQLGHVEEVTDEQARYQMDINFFGALNFTRAVLPHMRQRQSGIIVQLSSTAGIVGMATCGLYCASKFALEGMSETLYDEVKPFNIRVHIVEPGPFRTDFLGRQSRGGFVSQGNEAYEKTDTGLHGTQSGDPVKGCQRMFEVVTGTGMGKGLEWELKIPLGPDAPGVVETRAGQLRHTLEVTRDLAMSAGL